MFQLSTAFFTNTVIRHAAEDNGDADHHLIMSASTNNPSFIQRHHYRALTHIVYAFVINPLPVFDFIEDPVLYILFSSTIGVPVVIPYVIIGGLCNFDRYEHEYDELIDIVITRVLRAAMMQDHY